MNERNMVEQLRDGNREAFRALYDRYAPQMIKTATLILKDRMSAEDAVQETFIECYRRIGSLRQAETFGSWLYKILIRKCWDKGSKEKRHADIADLELEDKAGERPDQAVMRKWTEQEMKRTLSEALEMISLPQRTVLVLHYFNGMPVKEIAKTVNCLEGTVKARLHHGRKKLAELLGNRMETNGDTSPILKEEWLHANGN